MSLKGKPWTHNTKGARGEDSSNRPPIGSTETYDQYNTEAPLEIRQSVSKRISQLIIENFNDLVVNVEFPTQLKQHQRVISGGKAKTGRNTNDERLLIYGNELQAAFEDIDNAQSGPLPNGLTVVDPKN